MQVNERDRLAAKSLIEILGKAKFELVGAETIIVSRVLTWAVDLEKRFAEALSAPKPVLEISKPSLEAPKSVEQSSKKNKKSA